MTRARFFLLLVLAEMLNHHRNTLGKYSGKKSKRNTEKASGFHFALEKLYLGWKKSAMNSQEKSTSICITALRAVLGAGVYLLLQDRSLMSVLELAVGPKI